MARLAATLPMGMAIVQSTGEIAAANAGGLALIEADNVADCPCETTRDALTGILARLVAVRPLAAAHARIRRADRLTLYLAATKIDGAYVGLMLRLEARRDDLTFHALVDRLGLSSSDARLAMRVREGMNNAEIAAAFDLPVGTVKTRLSRMFRRLGVRCRADVAQRVESVRASEAELAPPFIGTDALRLNHPAVEAFLSAFGSGLAVIDSQDRWRWTNLAAQRLRNDVLPTDLDAALSRADGDGDIQTGAIRIRAQRWSVDDHLRGVKFDPKCERVRDQHDYLVRRFLLSAQQARVAVHLHRGASSAQIATATGLCRSTVRVVCSDIYAKLGVRDRTSLVMLLATVLS